MIAKTWPDRVQRDDALAQPRAAGVPEADDRARRRPAPARTPTRIDLAAGLAHRAALDRRVGAERDRGRAVDPGRSPASIPLSSSGVISSTRARRRRASASRRSAGCAGRSRRSTTTTLAGGGDASCSDAPDGEGDVVAAEAERVVERGELVAGGQRPRLAAHDVEVDLVVEVLEVDRGRCGAVVQRPGRWRSPRPRRRRRAGARSSTWSPRPRRRRRRRRAPRGSPSPRRRRRPGSRSRAR